MKTRDKSRNELAKREWNNKMLLENVFDIERTKKHNNWVRVERMTIYMYAYIFHTLFILCTNTCLF